MDRRVTSPPCGPLPPCNQALALCILYCIIKGVHSLEGALATFNALVSRRFHGPVIFRTVLARILKIF